MRRSGVLAIAAFAAVLSLSACAPAHPAPSGHAKPVKTQSAKPTATPTPTESPLPSDVLFEITAAVTAPDGSTATFTETVKTPVDRTEHQSGDETTLDQQCEGWRQAFPTIQYLEATVTSTLKPGDTWSDDDGRIAMDMAGYPIWNGDQEPYQQLCATALAVIPGTAHAVSPVAGGKPDAIGGWAVFRYGFTAVGVDGAPAPDGLTFSHCHLQLGEAAQSSIFASTWAAHPETDGGSACKFGGTS
jgi:hypothetical protein